MCMSSLTAAFTFRRQRPSARAGSAGLRVAARAGRGRSGIRRCWHAIALGGVGMTQTVEATDRYARDFDALRRQREEEPLWLRDLRREGFDYFQRMGWPVGEKRDEMWKYTDVRPVARTEFRNPAAPIVSLSEA